MLINFFVSTVVSLVLPLAYRIQQNNHYLHRLLVIFLTCAPTFVILTISYEGLFYLVFSVTLVCWVRLEHAIFASSSPGASSNGGDSSGSTRRSTSTSSRRGSTTEVATTTTAASNGLAKKQPGASDVTKARLPPPFRPLTLHDARVALFFFVLLQSAFFSTGNIASISSFSLESVARLLPVFDPFSQGAMLILKLMIPFALVSANLGVLNKRLGVAPSALFMVVTGVSDVLTLHFFWVVKDEGSWLEIGSTISHFVVASLLCVFVAALEGVSGLFISGVEVGSSDAKSSDANAATPPATTNATATALADGRAAAVLLDEANGTSQNPQPAG